MYSYLALAWIYWDPNPEIFTIPLIDRAIRWYGLCFVIGFMLGYLIIADVFRKRLQNQQTLSYRDIINWPILIKILQAYKTSSSPLVKSIHSRLDRKSRDILGEMEIGQEPDNGLKASLLASMNEVLNDPTAPQIRSTFEALFPKAIASAKEHGYLLADRLTWYVIAGTLIGARLGHVFFYEWPFYAANPIDIIKIWEGGLASHGGALGVILALFWFQIKVQKEFPEITFVSLLDMVSIPTALTACFIRIGNFFNQEILGPETEVPWGVVFGHPMDGTSPVPRHPSQLYEAAAYLITFCILYKLWRKWGNQLSVGMFSGLFFTFIFGSRFCIEFLKTPQSMFIDESFLQVGQYLSIPFIVFGLYLYNKGSKLDYLLLKRQRR
jgi:prolipoprotein diacylglyceryl transferase